MLDVIVGVGYVPTLSQYFYLKGYQHFAVDQNKKGFWSIIGSVLV